MKKLFLLLIIVLQACVFERNPDLNVQIINHSKIDWYVGEINGCDTCAVMLHAQTYCSIGNDNNYFPQVIKAGDSAIMLSRYAYTKKISAINVDSLKVYCKKKHRFNLSDRHLVKVYSQNVDVRLKRCQFIIN
jgi:hypothetical protein